MTPREIICQLFTLENTLGSLVLIAFGATVLALFFLAIGDVVQ